MIIRALVRIKRLRRRMIALAVTCAVAPVLAVAGAQLWVSRASDGHIYDVADVPETPVALVLGALEVDGRPSGFLAARLDVAYELYTRGKVRAILISGDNGRPDYDEPTAGRDYLIRRGIPAQSIALDYAGFDTYDSCVRARKIFGADRLTIVSQEYHLPRAVAVCRSVGVDAVGSGTDAYAETSGGLVAEKRELLANVKAVLDTGIGRDPVFLGRQEESVRAAVAWRRP